MRIPAFSSPTSPAPRQRVWAFARLLPAACFVLMGPNFPKSPETAARQGDVFTLQRQAGLPAEQMAHGFGFASVNAFQKALPTDPALVIAVGELVRVRCLKPLTDTGHSHDGTGGPCHALLSPPVRRDRRPDTDPDDDNPAGRAPCH